MQSFEMICKCVSPGLNVYFSWGLHHHPDLLINKTLRVMNTYQSDTTDIQIWCDQSERIKSQSPPTTVSSGRKSPPQRSLLLMSQLSLHCNTGSRGRKKKSLFIHHFYKSMSASSLTLKILDAFRRAYQTRQVFNAFMLLFYQHTLIFIY